MIRFTEKRYSKINKQNLGLAIAGTSLGISALNAGINYKHSRGSKKYQDDQLRAMNSLTRALTNVNSTIKSSNLHSPATTATESTGKSFPIFNFNRKQ